jgi:hypothetical protein
MLRAHSASLLDSVAHEETTSPSLSKAGWPSTWARRNTDALTNMGIVLYMSLLCHKFRFRGMGHGFSDILANTITSYL